MKRTSQLSTFGMLFTTALRVSGRSMRDVADEMGYSVSYASDVCGTKKGPSAAFVREATRVLRIRAGEERNRWFACAGLMHDQLNSLVMENPGAWDDAMRAIAEWRKRNGAE